MHLLMTRQDKMLTAVQNKLCQILLDLSNPLLTGPFLFVIQTGNGDHCHRNYLFLPWLSSADTAGTLLTLIIHPVSSIDSRQLPHPADIITPILLLRHKIPLLPLVRVRSDHVFLKLIL